MLPARRKKPRFGTERAPEREWSKHEKWVRGFDCVVSIKTRADCDGKVQFAHVLSAADAGKGIKSFSWYGVPMCAHHHEEQHTKGAETFMAKYGIDLWARAAEFTAKSPDREMREAMKEWQVLHRIEHGGRLPIPPRRLGAYDGR